MIGWFVALAWLWFVDPCLAGVSCLAGRSRLLRGVGLAAFGGVRRCLVAGVFVCILCRWWLRLAPLSVGGELGAPLSSGGWFLFVLQ